MATIETYLGTAMAAVAVPATLTATTTILRGQVDPIYVVN